VSDGMTGWCSFLVLVCRRFVVSPRSRSVEASAVFESSADGNFRCPRSDQISLLLADHVRGWSRSATHTRTLISGSKRSNGCPLIFGPSSAGNFGDIVINWTGSHMTFAIMRFPSCKSVRASSFAFVRKLVIGMISGRSRPGSLRQVFVPKRCYRVSWTLIQSDVLIFAKRSRTKP